MMAKACPFCEVAAGAGGAHIAYEDEATIAFLDRSPLALGHCLLIPKVHVATIYEADAKTLTALALATKAVASAVTGAMGADGSFVAQNNVISQSVPHLHVHIVPRWKGDGLFAHKMVWRRVKYESAEEMAATAANIRAAM